MTRCSLVALAGQSGSGKSHVAARLSALGFPVVDCDALARQAVEAGSPCLDALVRAFSPDILLPDGSLHRKALGERCFADPAAKKRLDAITHPYILDLLAQRLQAFYQQGERLCVVEAPALVESGLHKLCQRIVLVTAPFEDKVRRIMARDNLTRERAEQRLASQLSEEELLALADLVLDNSGDLADLDAQVDRLAATLNAWFPPVA